MNPDETHPSQAAPLPNPLEGLTKKGSAFDKLKKDPHKLIMVVTLVLVVLIIGGSWLISMQRKPTTRQADRPWDANPKFPPSQVVGKVGHETIYGDDLNYKLYSNYPRSRSQTIVQVSDLKPQIEVAIATESAILQAARDQKIVDVPADLLNNPAKDQVLRSRLIQQIRQKVQDGSTKSDYSVISVWFYNMFKPSMPLELADKLAASTINQIYQQLLAKKIDMKQAGDLIKNNSQLSTIDTNFKGNAYSLIEGLPPGKGPSRFDQINTAVLSLGVGEMSPIIKVVKKGMEVANNNKLPYSSDGSLNANEQFYAVIKLESTKSGIYPGLRQWIDQAVKRYSL